jgi:hypothetical protein
MHEESAKTWLPSKGVAFLLKATLPTCVLSRRGMSLHQHAPRSSPLRHGGWVPRVMQAGPGQKEPNRRARSVQLPSGYKHSSTFAQISGRKDEPPCRRHATTPRGRTLSTSTRPAWGPRPTRHVTGAPVTTCKKLHRHLRQYRAFSTVEPVPRLKVTLRTAQQYQPSTSVTGQSTAGEDAAVGMAKSGPTVMAAAGGRKQHSSRLQAHVPSWDSERALSNGVKTTHPCSVPQTARARTTAAPPTTRLIALTLQQDRRHLWQAKQATLHLRHNDRVKKGAPRHSISYPFPLPLSLSCYRDRERGCSERDPSPRRKQAPSPPTDQRFEGWPLGRVRQPPQSTRAPRLLLIRGS